LEQGVAFQGLLKEMESPWIMFDLPEEWETVRNQGQSEKVLVIGLVSHFQLAGVKKCKPPELLRI
jgi:hypothetical protein